MSAVDATNKIEPRFDRQVRTSVLQDLEAEAVSGAGGAVVCDGQESLEPRHGDFGGGVVVVVVEWDGAAVVEVGCDVVTLGTGWSYKYLYSVLLSIRRYLDIWKTNISAISNTGGYLPGCDIFPSGYALCGPLDIASHSQGATPRYCPNSNA